MTEDEKRPLLKIQYGDLYIQAPKEFAAEALIFVARKLGLNLAEKKPVKEKEMEK